MSTIRQYRAFVAAAQEGSLTSAAQKLGISIPAISKQVRLLEAATGTQLLERTSSGVRLTDSGARFHNRCRKVLREIDEAEDELRSAATDMAGRISITLSRSLAVNTIYDLFARFHRLHPEVQFDITFDESLQNLQEANIDFAFRIGRLEDSTGIVALPLSRVRPTLCATPGYLQWLENDNPISKGTMVLPMEGNLSPGVRERLGQWGLDLKHASRHTVTAIDGVYSAVQAGLGIGILLDIAVEDELRTGALKELQPGSPLPSKPLYLLYSKERPFLRRHKCFKDFIRTSARSLGQ